MLVLDPEDAIVTMFQVLLDYYPVLCSNSDDCFVSSAAAFNCIVKDTIAIG
jgi:hypothetical protein